MDVLVTCPPMRKAIEEFRPLFESKGLRLVLPEMVQILPVEQLVKIVPTVDAWIIGDDPATAEVFTAGKAGKLKAAVKWGVGTDNVDFVAAKALGIPIANTPGMFGEEVSDVALAYLLALARHTHVIDKQVKSGNWFKPPGMSVAGKKAAVIGFGDIGKSTARKLKAFNIHVSVYDPYAKPSEKDRTDYTFDDQLFNIVTEAQFLIVTCALTPSNKHMVNEEVLQMLPDGAFVINVSRGPLVAEKALLSAMESGKVAAAGLDVFEIEPLAKDHPFTKMDNVIVGSHNGSNTQEAVRRASFKAIEILFGFLNIG